MVVILKAVVDTRQDTANAFIDTLSVWVVVKGRIADKMLKGLIGGLVRFLSCERVYRVV